jgi:hypothetical protein
MLAEAHNLWVHDKHSMPLGMVSYYCCKAVEFIYSIFVLFQMCDKVFLTSSCEGSVPSCHSVEGFAGRSKFQRACYIVLTCFSPAGAPVGLEANTIYISNLPESVTEDSLAALLSETANIKVHLLYSMLV